MTVRGADTDVSDFEACDPDEDGRETDVSEVVRERRDGERE